MISATGLRLIKGFEGFRSSPYYCSAGILTIGIGHAILPGESIPNPITEEEAESILQKDLIKTEKAIYRLIKSPLSENQFSSLASWTFNLGAGALQRSTLRAMINRQEYDEAPDQILKWIYAGGRKLRGLVVRRIIEARLFACG